MTFTANSRSQFHKDLKENCLSVDDLGIVSIADKDNKASCSITAELAKMIGPLSVRAKVAGQTAGNRFEEAVERFLRRTLPALNHLRSGKFEIVRGGAIHRFQQYLHLDEIQELSKTYPEIATSIGSDYIIAPDITYVRHPESDETINQTQSIVGKELANKTGLRSANNASPIVIASVSCKWTIRSDRAQNSRSEALNLIKNRKGRTPTIAIVTAESLPSRLSSVALGTGEVDMVYHIALPELIEAVRIADGGDAVEQLRIMVEGNRLRDISDLPFDLIV